MKTQIAMHGKKLICTELLVQFDGPERNMWGIAGTYKLSSFR